MTRKIIKLWEQPNFIKTEKPLTANILEGYHKGEMSPGDFVEIKNYHHDKYIISKQIVKVIERRDMKGVFENPEDKINAYFKIEVKI